MNQPTTITETESSPCRICGNATEMRATRLCNRCWELDSRIRRDPEIAAEILAAVTGNAKTEGEWAEAAAYALEHASDPKTFPVECEEYFAYILD